MKSEKMTFVDYYKKLPASKQIAPKTAFVKEIAEICMVADQTVRMWIQEVQSPDALKRSLISKHLNISEESLFPNAKI